MTTIILPNSAKILDELRIKALEKIAERIRKIMPLSAVEVRERKAERQPFANYFEIVERASRAKFLFWPRNQSALLTVHNFQQGNGFKCSVHTPDILDITTQELEKFCELIDENLIIQKTY
jgi:hypothetical protein